MTVPEPAPGGEQGELARARAGSRAGFIGLCLFIVALAAAVPLWFGWEWAPVWRGRPEPQETGDPAWQLAVPHVSGSPTLAQWARREDGLPERAARILTAPVSEAPRNPSRQGESETVPAMGAGLARGAGPEGRAGSPGRTGSPGGAGSAEGTGLEAAFDPAGPKLAIVIDDWGYPWPAADDFLRLPGPLTVAVIPHLPLSEEHAARAWALGHEVLLHLPMQPLNDGAPVEPGTVRVDMSHAEIVRTLDAALASVFPVAGVNNHMGSRATADPKVMHVLAAELKRRGLFFLDSYTTPRSVAVQAAGAHGLPLAVNQVFLDSDPREEAVERQLRKAMALALEQGEAVAIGHVRPATYGAVARILPELEAAGIRLVPVSRLVRPVTVRPGPGPLARRVASADLGATAYRIRPRPGLPAAAEEDRAENKMELSAEGVGIARERGEEG